MTIRGTEGSVFVDRHGYIPYDSKDEAVRGSYGQRTGRALGVELATGRIVDDASATKLWGREYAPGWPPAGAWGRGRAGFVTRCRAGI